jgi:L-lactate dehydrogenase complex protein LldG
VHGPVDPRGLAEAVASVCRSRGSGPIRVDPSLAPDLGTGPWEPIDPEARGSDLADTKHYVARGIVGVAENGAVGVPLGAESARGALFLCEHLILVLDPSVLEADLHRGMERLAGTLRAGTSHVWISGPSKTADIEQALVFGAHGPRTLDLVGLLQPGS